MGSRSKESTSKNKKILLIEDDEFLRQLYLDILGMENFDVETADNGNKALTMILQGDYSLILLDIMLPGLSGKEIAQQLNYQPGFKKYCPIVFLTNMDGSVEIKDVKTMIDDCWIKSNMSPPEFIQRVKSIVK